MSQWNRPLLLCLFACALACSYVVGTVARAEDAAPAPNVAYPPQAPALGAPLPETTSWGYLPIPKGSCGQVLCTEPVEAYGYCIVASDNQVRGFYEREMAVDGWSYVGERTTDEGVQWLYLRDDAASAIAVQSLEEYNCLFVQLTFADHLPGEVAP